MVDFRQEIQSYQHCTAAVAATFYFEMSSQDSFLGCLTSLAVLTYLLGLVPGTTKSAEFRQSHNNRLWFIDAKYRQMALIGFGT